ncbi:hypothetical protein [Ancylobacter dichloromethanicus]|uniref:hypothetical protein n=1 Tax=Ancylobacter dichloromethanicus TaxID=518825 RepID=UPI003614717E
MTRVLFIGLWVCLITLLASYGGVYWMTGTSPGSDESPTWLASNIAASSRSPCR